MRTLRTAAWINVGLHVVGLVFAAAARTKGEGCARASRSMNATSAQAHAIQTSQPAVQPGGRDAR